MKPRVEIWKSNQSQEERHFFMPNEANTYIFGFNPQIISKKMAQRIVYLMLTEPKVRRHPHLASTPNSMRRLLKK